MALGKRTESNTVFLQAKHYCLWREIKKPVEGSDAVEVTNPKTKQTLTKYGFKYNFVEGRAVDLVKYDTGDKYQTRYFGFKLHLRDGADAYVLDMPYQSQMLRRFLRVAPSINWGAPLKITVFKGKSERSGDDELGVWFQQGGETVKQYFTKENPRGMPLATQDPDTKEWDFKPQHRWLIERLKAETIPTIQDAAEDLTNPVSPEVEPMDAFDEHMAAHDDGTTNSSTRKDQISDDDVPF